MHRSIVIEGPDNSGKSTLAKNLSKILKFPIIKAGPPPKSNSLILTCCDLQYFWMLDRPCIFDRITPISHQCYNDLDEQCINYLNSKLYDMRPMFILIYCNVKFNFTQENYESDNDKKIVEDRYEKVIEKYRKIMLTNRAEIIFSGKIDSVINDLTSMGVSIDGQSS